MLNRVAFFSPGWPPGQFANGIVGYTEHLMRALSEFGVNSHVLAFYTVPGQQPPEMTPVGDMPTWSKRVLWRVSPKRAEYAIPTLSAVRSALALYRRWRFDICEIEETEGWSYWVERSLPVPTVVRLHGPWFLNGAARGAPRDAAYERRLRREGRALAAARAVSAPSRDVLEQVKNHYGIPLKDAVVIPNPGPIPRDDQQWQAARSEPGHILFIGRFDRHKGGDLILDAFVDVARRVPDARLTFAGPDLGVVDDSGREWSFPDYLTAKVPPELQPKVTMLGRVSQEDVAGLRQRASVVVSASRYENFALALLEAQSQGCPIVSSDAGGSPEIVTGDQNGLLFRTGDAASLAEALVTMLTRPELAARLGETALRDYRARFLPELVARSTLAFYEDVVRRAGT